MASANSSSATNHPVSSATADTFENDVIALFVDIAGMFGLPRSYGEIYGLLYASARPLSFTDIQARLDLSKGTASQVLFPPKTAR